MQVMMPSKSEDKLTKTPNTEIEFNIYRVLVIILIIFSIKCVL